MCLCAFGNCRVEATKGEISVFLLNWASLRYSAHFFRTRGPTGKNGLAPREAAAPRSIDVGKAYMPFVWSLFGGGSRGGGGGIVPGGCGSIVCVIAGEPARFAVDGRGDAAHESTKELRVAAVAGR